MDLLDLPRLSYFIYTFQVEDKNKHIKRYVNVIIVPKSLKFQER